VRTLYRKMVNLLAARNADAIVTVSESSKQDIIRLLNVTASKINVIYPGLDRRFQPAQIKESETERLRKKYGLPERFVLFVGQIQPRKNIGRLLEAFSLVRRKHQSLKLVIVGKQGWMYQQVFATIENLGLKQAVVFTGYADDRDLPGIYRLAEVFAFPSLYEGFGFPILEAMGCGVPVITSDSSSLGEIAHGAAMLVDPKNVKEIEYTLDRCLSDPNLQKKLREQGLRRAARFTWTHCAEQTLSVYLQTAQRSI